MALLDAPPVVDTADELLPLARFLIDEETEAFDADPDVTVTCGPGCNACCEHAVVVTAAEHRAIDAALGHLSPSVRQQVVARAVAVLRRVDGEIGVDPSGVTGFDPAFSMAYYALREPCPLLIDGRCAVRAVRPLVCREYLMSSSPSACEDRSLEQVVRIRRRRRVSAGFRRISAEFGEETSRLLPVALVGSASAPVVVRRSGPRSALHLVRT